MLENIELTEDANLPTMTELLRVDDQQYRNSVAINNMILNYEDEIERLKNSRIAWIWTLFVVIAFVTITATITLLAVEEKTHPFALIWRILSHIIPG